MPRRSAAGVDSSHIVEGKFETGIQGIMSDDAAPDKQHSGQAQL